jgi:hypothetical protein
VDQTPNTRSVAKVGIVAVVGIALIVSGGVVAKNVNAEAGSAMIALGGWLVGWLKTQPPFARP